MEDMNDILSASTETTQTEPEPETETELSGQDDGGETGDQQATGETTQVAAETEGDEPAVSSVKAELAALSKERERLRQKEAQLDEERERLLAGSMQTPADGQGDVADQQEAKDPSAEIKALRKQYREAMAASILDPDDAEAAQLMDDLEDRMEALRLSMVQQAQRTMSAQEKAVAEYDGVYKQMHDDFPFLSPKHPQSNAELNENINTYMAGRIQRGDSHAVALQKAVDAFAPAYAKSIESASQDVNRVAETTQTDPHLREKLSRGGFSEVRSVGRTATKPRQFTGPTPMKSILGKG